MTTTFWDARKSATLSIVVAWTALATGVAVGVLLVPLLGSMTGLSPVFSGLWLARTATCLYVCLAFGILADIVLLFLLRDIRRGEVFTAPNVRRLRLISYCGFAITLASVIGAIITPPRLIFVGLAGVAAFLGLLMRVIKNIIDTARQLKEDADYTI